MAKRVRSLERRGRVRSATRRAGRASRVLTAASAFQAGWSGAAFGRSSRCCWPPTLPPGVALTPTLYVPHAHLLCPTGLRGESRGAPSTCHEGRVETGRICFIEHWPRRQVGKPVRSWQEPRQTTNIFKNPKQKTRAEHQQRCAAPNRCKALVASAARRLLAVKSLSFSVRHRLETPGRVLATLVALSFGNQRLLVVKISPVKSASGGPLLPPACRKHLNSYTWFQTKLLHFYFDIINKDGFVK